MYELLLVPPGYNQLKSVPDTECFMCNSKLQVIDTFINLKELPECATEFESRFSICEECSTPHLTLITGEVDFNGPVLIGWD